MNDKINAQQYNMGPVGEAATGITAILIVTACLVGLAARLGWPGAALAGAAAIGLWGKLR